MNTLDQFVYRLQKDIEFLKQADIDYRDNRETFFEKYHFNECGNDVYDRVRDYDFLITSILNHTIVPGSVLNSYKINIADKEILKEYPSYELKYIDFI